MTSINSPARGFVHARGPGAQIAGDLLESDAVAVGLPRRLERRSLLLAERGGEAEGGLAHAAQRIAEAAEAAEAGDEAAGD